jgi:transketolase
MRAAFFSTIEGIYSSNRDIYVLTADLGYKLFDKFRQNCSDRFYDIGVAEANMIGIASGLSLSGKNVYCYSIIPFIIMRAYEQIRIDIAYHNLNVKLVGVGGGVTYGLEGFTHFGLEDFALMRSLPNMTIVAPADPLEARHLARISYEHAGPMYIRLGKAGDPAIYDKMPEFRIGKPIVLREGKQTAIFAIGSMVHTGKQVAEMLEKEGVNATLINMHTLKPLDKEFIGQISRFHDAIFTLEEHYTDGGLGSAVAEVIAESRFNGIFKRFGIDKLNSYIGKSDFLKEKYGLTTSRIYKGITAALKEI